MNELVAVNDIEETPIQVCFNEPIEHDDEVIAMWLHGKSNHTKIKYHQQVKCFLNHVEKTIQQITLKDLQSFADSLARLKLSSQACYLASVKSLLSFSHKMGYTKVNVGTVLSLPKDRDTLNERILSESQVHTLLNGEPKQRNRIILRLLYASGVRVSELCGLRWKDVVARDDKGQITVFGKGSKTRTILLSVETFQELINLKGEADENSAVFQSQKKGHLAKSQVWRIVNKAGERMGLKVKVSPHFFRHAHASHALERGASISLVQTTLGHSSVSTTGRYLHSRPTESSGLYLGA